MFDSLVTATAGTRRASAVGAWSRVENAACARRIAAMVDTLEAAYAADGSADRDQWCVDNWGAVTAHVGAVQRITARAADRMLLVGVALRQRLPRVAALFAAGEIGYPLVKTIVIRTALVTDLDAQHQLDAALAEALAVWEPLSVDKTEKAIDALIAAVDPVAVRRTKTRARDRHVDVVIEDDGMATLRGTLFAHDGAVLDRRLNALADTVCPGDPRTRDQRRADAHGLLQGADRLPCLCQSPDCPAGSEHAAGAVVVYVVAHEDTISPPDDARPEVPSPVEPEPALDATRAAVSRPVAECAGLDGDPTAVDARWHGWDEVTWAELTTPSRPTVDPPRPGYVMGGRVLPGSVSRRAAMNATLVPILHPGQAPPEHRYAPSKKLADFVRARDLTCRFPGCRQPATDSDIDHTIPYPHGPTCASNLKCLCRFHHLLKTFWGGPNGWRDRQHPDGTVEWVAPDGRTHATAPGSRPLFPELCAPTAPVEVAGAPPPVNTSGLAMPTRRRVRGEDRARRIQAERDLNATLIEQAVTRAGEQAAEQDSSASRSGVSRRPSASP